MEETTNAELKRLWDEEKRQNERIKNIEDKQEELQKLTISVERLTYSIESQCKALNDHGTRLEALEKEPLDTAKHVKNTIISTILGVLAGAIATGFVWAAAQAMT